MQSIIPRREQLFAYGLIFPCFAFVTIFAFYPILYSFYLSMQQIIAI